MHLATTPGRALVSNQSTAAAGGVVSGGGSGRGADSSAAAKAALQLLQGAASLCAELLAWQHGALDPWASPGEALKLPLA